MGEDNTVVVEVLIVANDLDDVHKQLIEEGADFEDEECLNFLLNRTSLRPPKKIS